MANDAPDPVDKGQGGETSEEARFWGVGPGVGALALRENPVCVRVYDLEERTANFGEAIVLFAKKVPRSPVNDRLAAQLVAAGTSVGANYCEADDGVSKKDFRNKIGICRKEALRPRSF